MKYMPFKRLQKESAVVEGVRFSPWLTLKTIWLAMYGNDLENHMVDVDDEIGKRRVKPNIMGPRGGPIILGLTPHFPILSSTSTIWFSRSLPYMVNHMVFNVNYTVQGQPRTQLNPFYSQS